MLYCHSTVIFLSLCLHLNSAVYSTSVVFDILVFSSSGQCLEDS